MNRFLDKARHHLITIYMVAVAEDDGRGGWRRTTRAKDEKR